MQTPDDRDGRDAPAPPRGSAWRIGLAWGLILGAATFTLSFVFDLLYLEALSWLMERGLIVALLLATGAAAARRGASAPVAGIVAALTAGLISLLLGLTYLGEHGIDLGPLYQVGGRQMLNPEDTSVGLSLLAILAALISLAVFMAVGALLGWVGGRLFGRRPKGTRLPA